MEELKSQINILLTHIQNEGTNNLQHREECFDLLTQYKGPDFDSLMNQYLVTILR